MHHGLRCLLLLTCAGLLALPVAAQRTSMAPPAPALQAELDAAVGAYRAGRAAEAAHAMLSLAQRGVPAAQFNLGLMHLQRELPDSDPTQAEQWLHRAAAGGFVTAMALLGQAYETGRFGPGSRDLQRAHDWYELAAEAGSVTSQVAMGTAHYLGRGRPPDAAQALHWYREAAKGGDEGAMYLVASMYEAGLGAARDLRLARHWYREAARAGDPVAAAKALEMDARMATDGAL